VHFFGEKTREISFWGNMYVRFTGFRENSRASILLVCLCSAIHAAQVAACVLRRSSPWPQARDWVDGVDSLRDAGSRRAQDHLNNGRYERARAHAQKRPLVSGKLVACCACCAPLQCAVNLTLAPRAMQPALRASCEFLNCSAQRATLSCASLRWSPSISTGAPLKRKRIPAPRWASGGKEGWGLCLCCLGI